MVTRRAVDQRMIELDQGLGDALPEVIDKLGRVKRFGEMPRSALHGRR
jgi:hypothetical protein